MIAFSAKAVELGGFEPPAECFEDARPLRSSPIALPGRVAVLQDLQPRGPVPFVIIALRYDRALDRLALTG
jgi:hypothetical protein